MKTRGSTGASAVRTADELTLNKDVFDSKHLYICCLPFHTLLTPGASSWPRGQFWPARMGASGETCWIRSYVHISLVLHLGRVSLQGSDGLQHVLQLATLVQIRHVAASSDTLVTDEHPWHLHSRLETDKLIKSSGVQSLHHNWDPHFHWSRARYTRPWNTTDHFLVRAARDVNAPKPLIPIYENKSQNQPQTHWNRHSWRTLPHRENRQWCAYRARPRQLHEVVLDLVHVAESADVDTLQMPRLEFVLWKDPLGHHTVRTRGLEEDHHFVPRDFGLDELLRHFQVAADGLRDRAVGLGSKEGLNERRSPGSLVGWDSGDDAMGGEARSRSPRSLKEITPGLNSLSRPAHQPIRAPDPIIFNCLW